MRIIVQTELYPPFVSGESVFSRHLAQGLARRGHEVRVFTASTRGWPEEHADGPVRVVRFFSLPNPAYATFRLGPWPILAARRLLGGFPAEAIHLNNPGPSARALLSQARPRGIRITATNHFIPVTAWLNRPVLRPLASLLERALWSFMLGTYSQVDEVTAPSRTALAILRQKGLRTPARVLSNGVDLERFHPSRRDRSVLARFGIPGSARVVYHHGRIYPSKRCDLLLEGWHLAPPDAWLLVSGDGPDRQRLETLAPPRVVFAGRVDDALLPTLYASADVFAIASEAELQGIVVLESLASGVPVLAADAGALPELVEPGVTGALFRPGDAEDFGRRIGPLLDAAPGLAPGARSRAEEHDLERTIDAFERLLLG